MEICREELCTGCCACLEICPVGAIKMQYRKDELLPKIDAEKCVGCGKCKNVCQVLNPIKLESVKRVYAACSRKKEDQEKSASGGIATSLARRVIQNGGIAIGAAVKEGIVKHIVAYTEEELELLRGSKYVQSYIGNSYSECKKNLKNGKKVIFFGTPCQIVGLKKYLGSVALDEKLITVDLICHGTPSFCILKDYMDAVVKKWDEFSFRGEEGWKLTISYNKTIQYQCNAKEDPYYYGFLEALTYRENCYSCNYADTKRCSDITIGDFWGLNEECKNRLFKGKDASVILINSQKGEQFFSLYEADYIFEERCLEEAANPAQENLLHPSVKHKDREKFMENLQTDNVFSALKNTPCIKRMIQDTRKNRVLNKLRRIKNKFYKV